MSRWRDYVAGHVGHTKTAGKKHKELRKTAQYGYGPIPDPAVNSAHQMANLKTLKAQARNIKNIVPYMVDVGIGGIAGVINGTGQLLGGGSFRQGFNESSDFVKKYYSDPMRKWLSWLGSPVRKAMDKSMEHYATEYEKTLGQAVMPDGSLNPSWKQYSKDIDNMNDFSERVGTATGVAASLPAYGALGKLFGLGKWGWRAMLGGDFARRVVGDMNDEIQSDVDSAWGLATSQDPHESKIGMGIMENFAREGRLNAEQLGNFNDRYAELNGVKWAR